jgi:hydrogenase maturation protease HycI
MKKPDSGEEGHRVAILGIGNELRGDDAAGIAVIRALAPAAHEQLLVVEGGPAPENHTGLLRRFQPNLVVLVDAAEMDEEPGTVRWLSWEAAVGLSASTHTTPPSMLARFLVETLGCAVILVGIQPYNTGFEAPMTDAVAAAVSEVAGELRTVYGNGQPAL